MPEQGQSQFDVRHEASGTVVLHLAHHLCLGLLSRDWLVRQCLAVLVKAPQGKTLGQEWELFSGLLCVVGSRDRMMIVQSMDAAVEDQVLERSPITV
jgi:hypothetical protein